MSEDATIGAPAAEASGGGVEPDEDDEEDETLVTVYTHNGEEWVPSRLAPGETTSIKTADGRPVTIVEVDDAETIAETLEGGAGGERKGAVTDALKTDCDYDLTD